MSLFKCVLLFVVVLSLAHQALTCRIVAARSETLGALRFEMMPKIPVDVPYQSSGRQVWIAERPTTKDFDEQPTLYLYHVVINEFEGLARWVIGTRLGSKTHAVAYIDSWAVTPWTALLLNDNAQSPDRYWQMKRSPQSALEEFAEGEHFEHTKHVNVECSRDSSDNTVYFDSSALHQPMIAGFYVETAMHPVFPNGLKSVYQQIKKRSNDKAMYMFKLNDDTWMIGEKPNVDMGLAFHADAEKASTPSEIEYHLWRYLDRTDNPTWNVDHGVVVGLKTSYHDSNGKLNRKSEENIYDAYHYYRSVKFVPRGQQYITLRNQIPLPVLGLGTGGIDTRNLVDVVTKALDIGYRAFDLAREYFNERTFFKALAEHRRQHKDEEKSKDDLIERHDIFLISKVWPTNLGFDETMQEINHSMDDLGTNYIDMYLLHWPACDRRIEWMHCETTRDPKATWRESWRALEKEYAEGRVNSIGVSNFDRSLLEELGMHAQILPHMVQNQGELTMRGLDKDVREWCWDRRVAYQPYAHQRNIQFLSPDTQESLEQMAEMHGKSVNNIVNKFFVQTGAAIIPRTSNIAHLKENSEIFHYELAVNDMADLGWNERDYFKNKKQDTAGEWGDSFDFDNVPKVVKRKPHVDERSEL